NNNIDVFVKDLQTGASLLVSRRDPTLPCLTGNGGSVDSVLSSNGRYVVFDSGANNLVPGDSNDTNDVFIKDLQTGALTRGSTDSNCHQVNNSSALPSISADGRYVAFQSLASNLVPGDSDNTYDVFLKDLQTGAVTRASTDSNGNQANNSSLKPSI